MAIPRNLADFAARVTSDGNISIPGTSTLTSALKIGDLTWNSSSGGGALVQYRGSDDYAELQINNPVAGTNAVTIRDGSDGTIVLLQDGGGRFKKCVGVGAATPAASGAGITFPATQSASSDANTLDDYEEGSFSPTIEGSTTAGTGTYAVQTGSYTKIGNRVFFNIYLSWTAHTGTGNLRVGNLPFTIANNNNAYGAISIYMERAISLTANNILQAYTNKNSTQLVFAQYATGGSDEAAVSIDTNAAFNLSGHYYV